MPLPRPSKSEQQDKEGQRRFLERCYADPNIRKEFKTNNRIGAVCYSLYHQAKKKKKDKKAELEASNNPNQPPNEVEFEPNWEETKAEIDKDGFIIL